MVRSRWLLVAQVAVTVAVAEGIALGIKAGVGRPRPPLWRADPPPLIPLPHSGSFPSGHATTAFAGAVVVAVAVPRLAVPSFVLAAAVAYSRVYVGVHYPLDVIAGAALGTAVAATVVAVTARCRRGAAAG